MVNLREEIEKDNQNLKIKNIISLEKDNNKKVLKVLVFASYKDKTETYCIVRLDRNNENNMWDINIIYNFDDFSKAIKKFAECRKTFLKTN